MGRKSKTLQLSEGILGQHIALSVAAHLARTQLVPEPRGAYDGQHLSEMLDVVANALARVAPLYVTDPKIGATRQLLDSELEGASIKRGATTVCLRDGRTLSSASMKRADLRQAIGILKTIGLPELTRRAPEAPKAQPQPERFGLLAAQMVEVERMLRPPLLPEQFKKCNRLLVAIARHAPDGRMANTAMRLMTAVERARSNGGEDDEIAALLARLRAALDDVEVRGHGRATPANSEASGPLSARR